MTKLNTELKREVETQIRGGRNLIVRLRPAKLPNGKGTAFIAVKEKGCRQWYEISIDSLLGFAIKKFIVCKQLHKKKIKKKIKRSLL